MKLKIIIFSYAGCLTLGIIIGRFSKKDIPKITQTQTTQQKIVAVQKIDNNTITHENIKSEKETIVTQKLFSPKGKLKKETQTQTVYNEVNLSEKTEAKNENNQIIEAKLTKDSLIIEPSKKWLVQGFIPMTNYKDYSEYTLQVSYRVYGQIWASAQSNLIFTRPMAGI